MEKVSRRAGEKASSGGRERVTDSPVPPFPDSKKGGFTLIEVLIALVVLAMGFAMLITMFTVGLKGVTTNQVRTQATNLAQELMDEIIGKEFRERTSANRPEWGYSADDEGNYRSMWDDVDDYATWKSKNPPLDISGNELTLYNDFTRSVSVAFVSAYDLQTPMGTAANTSCKRIIVYVEHLDIATVSLYGLKTLSVYQW